MFSTAEEIIGKLAEGEGIDESSGMIYIGSITYALRCALARKFAAWKNLKPWDKKETLSPTDKYIVWYSGDYWGLRKVLT